MRWRICKSAGSDGESVNLHPVTRLASDLGRMRQEYVCTVIVRYISTFVRYITRRLTTDSGFPQFWVHHFWLDISPEYSLSSSIIRTSSQEKSSMVDTGMPELKTEEKDSLD
jgi:hypothetical protein